MDNNEIVKFLYNEENIYNCTDCPYNEDIKNHNNPCGQQIYCERNSQVD